MNCIRCGIRLQQGQAHCSCGQYVDLPASELYTRIESQVEKSSRDNFRRGLLIGLGFLLLFLVLETSLDRFIGLRLAFVVAVFLSAAVGAIFNIWQLAQKLRSKSDDY